ncbi:hypothetical protein SAMN05421823_111178 [Catalinimonas alkaloidigena]|uniref:Uncharacterized protein n=1 Tax=Catalinimonas alkaloidigena TaxID=1075417 RepID=A0A1G9RJH2_9BACT|nr:hypothetical protein [Catalinimonas alkaloidigena]SDM23368.1 hypothetical protein SAMN05421823_111178 [Catalinimonas alkaloidigena]
MKAVVKIAWFISVLGFIIVLFGTYKDITDQVLLSNDLIVGRNTYFYLALALFAIGNSLILSFTYVMPQLPKNWYWVPQGAYWRSSFEHRRALDNVIVAWFYALTSVYNFFVMAGLLIIESNNHIAGEHTSYGWLLGIGVALLLLVMVALPVRLNMKRQSLANADAD